MNSKFNIENKKIDGIKKVIGIKEDKEDDIKLLCVFVDNVVSWVDIKY